MIEYHPYDLDIDGETDVNRRNIERIETATRGKEEIRFAVISDTRNAGTTKRRMPWRH